MNLIQDLDLKPSDRVLVRLDLNLPQDDLGNFTDLFRLESSLPTLKFLQEKKCKVFIIAHLGSPKGKPDPKLSLSKISILLQDKLSEKVSFISDPFNQNLNLEDSSNFYLLENLRFWSGEEENSKEFAQDLCTKLKSNFFIQDAFGVCHRAHASLIQIPKLIPSAAGLLLQKEISGLSIPPNSDLSLIVGGAKVESKLPVISNFLDSARNILTGGVVANTFLKADGKEIASSFVSEENIHLAKNFLKLAEQKNRPIQTPTDYVVAEKPDAEQALKIKPKDLKISQMILDIGPESTNNYINHLAESESIIWAGTLGYSEYPLFAEGSKKIAKSFLNLKDQNPKLKIIIGGGDTVDFIQNNLSLAELQKIDHISTGGGASLAFLAGQELPGIQALNPSSTSKEPIIAVNLKANFNLEQARSWFSELLTYPELKSTNSEIIVAAPDLFLEEFSSELKNAKLKPSPIQIYAEDISIFSSGSHTGEVSAEMLQDIASGTLLGHSERRINFGETNQDLYLKVGQALKSSLNLIFCIGSKDKDSVKHQAEIYEQLTSILNLFDSRSSKLLKIAYEPVFAIGTGDIPTPEFLNQQLSLISTALADYGLKVPILYGGSVDDSNFQNFLQLGFDGVLIGSDALKVTTLKNILGKT